MIKFFLQQLIALVMELTWGISARNWWNDGLNQSLEEHKLIDPCGKILDKTRDIVVHVFEKSEEEVKDGMDISCVF